MKRMFLTLLALLFLAACTNRPGDGEIQRQVTERLLGGNGGLFTVENFGKINGFESAQNVYDADVEYDLVFQKSCSCKFSSDK